MFGFWLISLLFAEMLALFLFSELLVRLRMYPPSVLLWLCAIFLVGSGGLTLLIGTLGYYFF